jgi:hypothetical protein
MNLEADPLNKDHLPAPAEFRGRNEDRDAQIVYEYDKGTPEKRILTLVNSTSGWAHRRTHWRGGPKLALHDK